MLLSRPGRCRGRLAQEGCAIGLSSSAASQSVIAAGRGAASQVSPDLAFGRTPCLATITVNAPLRYWGSPRGGMVGGLVRQERRPRTGSRLFRPIEDGCGYASFVIGTCFWRLFSVGPNLAGGMMEPQNIRALVFVVSPSVCAFDVKRLFTLGNIVRHVLVDPDPDGYCHKNQCLMWPGELRRRLQRECLRGQPVIHSVRYL